MTLRCGDVMIHIGNKAECELIFEPAALEDEETNWPVDSHVSARSVPSKMAEHSVQLRFSPTARLEVGAAHLIVASSMGNVGCLHARDG